MYQSTSTVASDNSELPLAQKNRFCSHWKQLDELQLIVNIYMKVLQMFLTLCQFVVLQFL
uniref:Uncharacterized protein n=1 Tax=Arion vulgaris TaxID=1028688 RepID=A0A0B7APY3_9EUPU